MEDNGFHTLDVKCDCHNRAHELRVIYSEDDDEYELLMFKTFGELPIFQRIINVLKYLTGKTNGIEESFITIKGENMESVASGILNLRMAFKPNKEGFQNVKM